MMKKLQQAKIGIKWPFSIFHRNCFKRPLKQLLTGSVDASRRDESIDILIYPKASTITFCPAVKE